MVYWAYAQRPGEDARWHKLEAETVWGVLAQLEGASIAKICTAVDADAPLEDQVEVWKQTAEDRRDLLGNFEMPER